MRTSDLIVYLKTTDTCNLNCDHCFTNGKHGTKGLFDVDASIDFFQRLKEYQPEYDNAHITFHGGEPLLAPSDMLFDVWNGVRGLWDNLWWSVQTNLTYPVTADRERVLTEICQKSWGTSWDSGIRWPEKWKEELWRNNVKELTGDGHQVSVMVCLSGNALQKEPIEIIEDMASLGIKHINFERVTANGNALDHLTDNIIPQNKELDAWLLKLWEQSVEYKTYEYIDNMFFDSILTSMVYSTRAGCRCRECEQKVLTINADGTVGGCPNGAVENTFGTIRDDINELMMSPGRICNIQTEMIRHPACSLCPVYDLCNGDCHQLGWQGNVCAAPKSMMIKLKQEDNIELYKKFLGDFMGQE